MNVYFINQRQSQIWIRNKGESLLWQKTTDVTLFLSKFIQFFIVVFNKLNFIYYWNNVKYGTNNIMAFFKVYFLVQSFTWNVRENIKQFLW